MTLIAGVKGDEFYITMNCGAQAKAKELGATLDFQGPDKFDAGLQTPVAHGPSSPEQLRGVDPVHMPLSHASPTVQNWPSLQAPP